ncbi:uncharacterized protein EAE97_010994 [Botrytis byssoidea]|uniref:Uncharacterized protein n=1 Tax=Botrytis byssoidea TaxID=139641 RepID=A0A9P5HZR0_9HELO|nr:uncharacterized protein EAE97_010994 [Botrytis byssoidea]KAF7922830.1 hypothetical protein EAE97_010994 [Botrytis byssoidea]
MSRRVSPFSFKDEGITGTYDALDPWLRFISLRDRKNTEACGLSSKLSSGDLEQAATPRKSVWLFVVRKRTTLALRRPDYPHNVCSYVYV